jgi:TPR repeat protein
MAELDDAVAPVREAPVNLGAPPVDERSMAVRRLGALLVLPFAFVALPASAELVRCTSKDGKSSVIRKNQCDSPDWIRTPVTATAPASSSARPTAPADDPMAAYESGDFVRARELLEPRANAGDPTAQLFMGDIYKNGRGVPKDEKAAYAWTRKAADQGDARGQAALAAMMQAGSGTPRDDAGALVWLEKSAQQDFALAQSALGFAYLTGRGTPEDEEKGVFWLRKAAAQGDAGAADALQKLGK